MLNPVNITQSDGLEHQDTIVRQISSNSGSLHHHPTGFVKDIKVGVLGENTPKSHSDPVMQALLTAMNYFEQNQ